MPLVAAPMEEKVEVVELAEVATPPIVEGVVVPSVVDEVAAPSVVEEVVVPEVLQEIVIARPIEPVSAPLEQGKKPWSIRFGFFRLGDKVTFLALFTVAIAFLGGVSFAGLLQSTESVGTSPVVFAKIFLLRCLPARV